MDKERWNRLYQRCLAAMQNADGGARGNKHTGKRRRIKNRWLAWAERQTGRRCFFVTWR